jgi:hypothetical protein
MNPFASRPADATPRQAGQWVSRTAADRWSVQTRRVSCRVSAYVTAALYTMFDCTASYYPSPTAKALSATWCVVDDDGADYLSPDPGVSCAQTAGARPRS